MKINIRNICSVNFIIIFITFIIFHILKIFILHLNSSPINNHYNFYVIRSVA